MSFYRGEGGAIKIKTTEVNKILKYNAKKKKKVRGVPPPHVYVPVSESNLFTVGIFCFFFGNR